MRPVSPADIKSNQDYEIARADIRRRVMEIKAARRVHVGENLTFLFENRDTVTYQVQEMMRAEGMTSVAEIKRELEVYNELVAGSDELCATLLIEYETPETRDRKLRELLGLESRVFLRVEGAGEIRAVFDMRQVSEDRISSVHYLKFPLGAAAADAIRAGAAVELGSDHPALSVVQKLGSEQAAALAADLSTE